MRLSSSADRLAAAASRHAGAPGHVRACMLMVVPFACTQGIVSTLGEDVSRVFARIVAICDNERLIGREIFAIDGVKLPSNASKQRSGTRGEFARQATKLEAATTAMVQRHRAALPRARFRAAEQGPSTSGFRCVRR